jgi:hypothetical protein
MKHIVKSKEKVDLPNGIYAGRVGGYNLTILSQDYFGKKIVLEFGIKTTGLIVLVVVKDSVAFCYDKSIMFK